MPEPSSQTRGRGRADRISISLPPQLVSELRLRATEQGRSLSNLCAQVLAGWVEHTRSET